MGDSITINFEHARFRNNLRRYQTEFNMSMKDVIKEQFRLVIKRCIAFTAPQGGRHSGTLEADVSSDTPRQQGEKAVQRDLERAMYPANKLRMLQAPTDPALGKLIASRDYQGLTRFLQKIPSFSRMEVVPFDQSLHSSVRDQHGRVRKNQYKIVLDWEKLNAFVANVKKSVGKAKSGWTAAYAGVGGTLPGWITRNSGAGSFEDMTNDERNPRMRGTNSEKSIGTLDQENRIIENAIKGRNRDMERDIELRLARAKSNAGLH